MTFEDIKVLLNELNEVYEKRRKLHEMKDELREKINTLEKEITPQKEMLNNLNKQVEDRRTEIQQLNDKETEIKRQMSIATYHIYYNLTKDGMYKDDDTVAFRGEDWDDVILYQDNELKRYYITKENTPEWEKKVLDCDIFYKNTYEDRLNEMKDEAYNNDNFLRKQRIDDIENYYCNDSLSEYLDWVLLDTVDYNDLVEDWLENQFILHELEWVEDDGWGIIFDSEDEYFELNKSENLWYLSE